MKKYIKIVVTQSKVPFTIQQGEAQVAALVKKAKQNHVDVLGLSEDCICGLLDTIGDYNALEYISKLAIENRICIFGSNVLKEINGKHYQTGFFINENGKLLAKTHKIILTPPEITIGIYPGIQFKLLIRLMARWQF